MDTLNSWNEKQQWLQKIKNTSEYSFSRVQEKNFFDEKHKFLCCDMNALALKNLTGGSNGLHTD